MQDGIQSWYKSIGDWGCYFLCLLDIAKEFDDAIEIDVFKIAKDVARLGYMKLNENNLKDPDNFYILQPHKILEYLTGGKWTVKWQPPLYQIKDGDYVIRCYVNPPHSHFNRPSFDSLQDSLTVRYGELDSYRIFNKVA